jgi:hypothetical protein
MRIVFNIISIQIQVAATGALQIDELQVEEQCKK